MKTNFSLNDNVKGRLLKFLSYEHCTCLKMSFLVGKNWIDKCCNKGSISIVASVTETEES